jgi:hypothetical protein
VRVGFYVKPRIGVKSRVRQPQFKLLKIISVISPLNGIRIIRPRQEALGGHMALANGLGLAWGFGRRQGHHHYSSSGLVKGSRYPYIPPHHPSITITQRGPPRKQFIGKKSCSRKWWRKGRLDQSPPRRLGFQPAGWSLRLRGATATSWICGQSTPISRCQSANTRPCLFCHSSAGNTTWGFRLTCNRAIMLWGFTLTSNNFCVFKFRVSIMFTLHYHLGLIYLLLFTLNLCDK